MANDDCNHTAGYAAPGGGHTCRCGQFWMPDPNALLKQVQREADEYAAREKPSR